MHPVHGAKRFSGRAFGDADYLQQQGGAEADAGCHFAEADGAGACTNCALLCEAQEGMRVQARDRPGRLAMGSFAGHRIVRKEHSESRPDDACESQAGVAVVRRGGLLDALPREPHQIRPGRKRGGDAEWYFKIAVRDVAENIRLHGKTEGDVCRQSRALHGRNSG